MNNEIRLSPQEVTVVNKALMALGELERLFLEKTFYVTISSSRDICIFREDDESFLEIYSENTVQDIIKAYFDQLDDPYSVAQDILDNLDREKAYSAIVLLSELNAR